MGFNLDGFGNWKELVGKAKSPGGLLELAKRLPLHQLLKQLPLDKLLTDAFMQKYTPFRSIGDLLAKTGLGQLSDGSDKVKELPEGLLDEKVAQHTSFGSMGHMLQKAAEFYQSRQGRS